MIRVSFDIGGVLSKQPHIWRPIVRAFQRSYEIEVFILSDMKPHAKAVSFCHDNGFLIDSENIHCCDYETHGEHCKAVKMKELAIDLHIDDFPGYLATGALVRLLVWPDPDHDYYHPDWVTDGSEGNFGRRKAQGEKA